MVWSLVLEVKWRDTFCYSWRLALLKLRKGENLLETHAAGFEESCMIRNMLGTSIHTTRIPCPICAYVDELTQTSVHSAHHICTWLTVRTHTHMSKCIYELSEYVDTPTTTHKKVFCFCNHLFLKSCLYKYILYTNILFYTVCQLVSPDPLNRPGVSETRLILFISIPPDTSPDTP